LFSRAGVFGGARTPLPTEPTERRLVRDNRKLLPAESEDCGELNEFNFQNNLIFEL
jgi:hypothetical protein